MLATLGCTSEVPPFDADRVEPAAELATNYDAAKIGRITGQVRWKGPIPHPQGFLYGRPRADGAGFEFRTAENPNRPHIDTKSRAVAEAVVFLRGVSASASRSWDLPPVHVEMGDGQIAVIQGKQRGRVGFVRRGDTISVASTDKSYQLLRGRGDAFFGLALPEPGQPVARTLSKAGRVELSSGTGLYWARADLFVADHPYYTLTDQDGRFSFDRVPMGEVEVVVWMPGWQPARMERDPDSTQVARQLYTPPIERTSRATLLPSQQTAVIISVP
jgi:hypothetical protein